MKSKLNKNIFSTKHLITHNVTIVRISATAPAPIENDSGVFHLAITGTITHLNAHAGLTGFRCPVDGQQEANGQKNESDHFKLCRVSEQSPNIFQGFLYPTLFGARCCTVLICKHV